jgi:hypothetical protein
MKWKRNVKNTWGLLKALINVSKQVNIDRLRRRRAVMSIFLNQRLNPKILSFATNSKNIELFCIQFLPFWGDVTISFLAFCLLKRQKQKKKARLFIVGYFEVILCSCQFDNFLFLSLNTLITNRTFRCNCQQRNILSRVQMKSWAGKALETVNCWQLT